MSVPEIGPEPQEVFAEPWQAQAFALVVALHERGLFGWPEWTAALGEALREHDDYHAAWVGALETMLVGKGIATGPAIDELAHAWSRAAAATPHGMPIVLENDPLGAC